jgi:imidazolonepropionase-like amidohydrolase
MTVSTLLLGGRLFDGVDLIVDSPAFVSVVDGTIAACGPVSELGDARHDQTIDLGSASTLMPGLINMHVHLSFSSLPTVYNDALNDGDVVKMIRITENLRAALAVGITTVRDCGTWPHLLLPTRDAVVDGLMPGPRIVASGAITTTGGHCWYCATEADSEDEVRKAVRAHVKDGVDFIKLFATGGNTTPGSSALVAQYTKSEMCAATEEARKAGRRTAAHAHGIEGVRNCVAARVTTIEHCSFQSEAGLGWDETMIDEMRAAGTFVCPTVFRGVTKRRDEPGYEFSEREALFETRLGERLDLTRRLYEAGIELVSGNDAGVSNCHITDFPGDLVYTGSGAGLPADAVLRSATASAAKALGIDDIGRIAPGMAADVLGLNGNPLQDLNALHSPALVMSGGSVVQRGVVHAGPASC